MGWRILLIVVSVLVAAVLELGKHTLWGWALAAVLLLCFGLGRHFRMLPVGGWKGLLCWCALFALLAGTLALSWPPMKPIPAVSSKGAVETEAVHTSLGDVSGLRTADGAVEVFAGIPYAKPPVGELRWREPQPVESWQGVLKADHFAPMSMQTRNLQIYSSLAQIIGYHDYQIQMGDEFREPVSEDSLYLNIWRPAGGGEKLPVLVYIHGGSLQSGQPSYADYSGLGLAREGVLVVNMGYRLGIFGFFADEELAQESPNGTTGNYGLLDQICALEWVRDHIASFGGDPENVTIAGESAGSACVTALCTSPLAKGLFRRAIGESSTVTAKAPAHSFRSLEDAYAAGRATKDKFNAQDIADLRALPAEKLVGELATHHHFTVDGYVLPQTPYESYQQGEFNEEGQLHGFNREEAAPFILFGQANAKNYEEKVRAYFGSYADRVLALYPGETDDQAKRNWADIYTVALFTYGHYNWEQQAIANGIPSYVYHFTKSNGRLGSWHSGEEVYFYGNIPENSKLYDAKDRELSRVMKSYFVNFIKTGDPNGEGLPAWPQGTGEGVMTFGDEISWQLAPYQELNQILDEMFGAV
ncbi:MAG: carboxylesterase family protein [Clostridia bacterium]|nr:carboxylesterase family protein [Clostridia bacterium]